MQHSLGPAIIVIPGVLIWGNGLNQILVSIIFGAMTAPVVFLVARYFSTKLTNQLLLTALMMFGTILWWVAQRWRLDVRLHPPRPSRSAPSTSR
jgi:hypothetical protein